MFLFSNYNRSTLETGENVSSNKTAGALNVDAHWTLSGTNISMVSLLEHFLVSIQRALGFILVREEGAGITLEILLNN